jgi:hypothetical protein
LWRKTKKSRHKRTRIALFSASFAAQSNCNRCCDEGYWQTVVFVRTWEANEIQKIALNLVGFSHEFSCKPPCRGGNWGP